MLEKNTNEKRPKMQTIPNRKNRRKPIFIYALMSPLSDKVEYIGQTNDMGKRMANHIYLAKNPVTLKSYLNKKDNWIRSLLEKNIFPIYKILEETDDNNAIERETYWINYFGIENLKNEQFVFGKDKEAKKRKVLPNVNSRTEMETEIKEIVSKLITIDKVRFFQQVNFLKETQMLDEKIIEKEIKKAKEIRTNFRYKLKNFSEREIKKLHKELREKGTFTDFLFEQIKNKNNESVFFFLPITKKSLEKTILDIEEYGEVFSKKAFRIFRLCKQ